MAPVVANAVNLTAGNVTTGNVTTVSDVAPPLTGEFAENLARGSKVICLCFGLTLGAMYIVAFGLFSSDTLRTRVKSILPNEMFASHAARGHTSMKRAANFKLTKMLINAFVLHDPNASKYFKKKKDSVDSSMSKDDTAMKNFVLYGDQNELSGGILWTWRRLLSRRLFDEEGVWISSRLIIIQFGQVIIAVIFVAVLQAQTPVFAEQVQTARDDLPNGLPGWVYEMVPEPWMIRTSLYPAVACAGAVCCGLILLYIPR